MLKIALLYEVNRYLEITWKLFFFVKSQFKWFEKSFFFFFFWVGNNAFYQMQKFLENLKSWDFAYYNS